MIKKLIILVLAILVCACEQNKGSEEQIYEVMDFVLKDQKLDKTHGLKLEPESQCSLDGPDKEFLKNLIEPPTKDTTALDSTKLKIVINYEFHLGQLTKCLTVGDVDYMIKQKDKNINFKWNNSKLGFDINNKKTGISLALQCFQKTGQRP